jgi:hypothetical protein
LYINFYAILSVKMRHNEVAGRSPYPVPPLSDREREAHPHTIFSLESTSRVDIALAIASFAAMRRADFPLAIDVQPHAETKTEQLVIRSATKERNMPSVESALFTGLAGALGRKVNDLEGEEADVTSLAGGQRIMGVADEMLGQIIGDEEFYKEFREYYGGLRWSTFQERFRDALFTHGTMFSPKLLDRYMGGQEAAHLRYEMDLDIPYDVYTDGYDMTPEEIFARHPELDYHRLEDEEFRSTPEGQKLLVGYQRLCGSILAEQYKAFPRKISDDGEEIKKPLVPLSKFPIVEALMVDEISLSKPRGGYNLGPSEVTELILQSDSEPAIDALVTAINTRLPEENRRVFDGPNEFQFKRRLIGDLLRQYERSYDDEGRRELLKRSLISVFEAYTDDGEIAQSVREEYRAHIAQSFSWSHSETYGVREVVSDILTITLGSPDAESFFGRYMPDFEKGLAAEADPLALDKPELVFVVLDALRFVSTSSRPEVFKSVGTKIFQDEMIGERLARIVEDEVEAVRIRKRPEVVKAFKKWRRIADFSLNEKSPEKEEAKAAYDALTAEADELSQRATKEKHALLFDILTDMLEAGPIDPEKQGVERRLFSGLVDRINFSVYDAQSLPWEYADLIKLANHPNVRDPELTDIVWQIQNRFEYIGEEGVKLLMPVVLDMYELILGSADNVRLPNDATSFQLAALSSVVRKHGRKLFKLATQDDLWTMARYADGMRGHVERIATGAFISEGGHIPDPEGSQSFAEWQNEAIDNLRKSVYELMHIEDVYKEFLHIEEVKTKPHVYYPWLLERLAPFWSKMQWEVSEGNRPKPEIKALHNMLYDHILNKLDIRDGDYPEDFDVFEDGHLDTLIYECYTRMIVPYDIKSNGTVWNEGLSFMHYAVAYMPRRVLEKFREKYSGDEHEVFIAYLERERARWNKGEEQDEDLQPQPRVVEEGASQE